MTSQGFALQTQPRLHRLRTATFIVGPNSFGRGVAVRGRANEFAGTASEPAGNREPLPRRRQNLVLVTVGEKADERAADGEDIARVAGRNVQAQGAAVGRGPRI